MRTSEKNILRWTKESGPTRVEDTLAREEPLEIRVDNHPVSVTMRTPGHDAELAVGFLFSEALVKCVEDIQTVEPHPRNEVNVVNVFSSPNVMLDLKKLTRHVFASSSCGLCGKATIDLVQQQFPPVISGARVSASVLLSLPEKLRSVQDVFEQSGGLHAAAIFATDGNLVVSREDVGRHNAVDKVIGHAVLKGISLSDHILLVSGRVSFEIVQKALAARIPVVAAISAPSSLAVEFAQENGQTLIAFLREKRMNIYAHPERVAFESPDSA